MSEPRSPHGVWLDDEEVAHIGEAGAGVAHCPTSNCYLADGAIRLHDLRSAGAVVSLGTDGSACDHRQDMFEQMKQSVFVQRLHHLDPTASNAEEALELATREGARFLGIDAGVLEAGKARRPSGGRHGARSPSAAPPHRLDARVRRERLGRSDDDRRW